MSVAVSNLQIPCIGLLVVKELERVYLHQIYKSLEYMFFENI